YAETEAGRVLLTPEIIPSAVINSASPQDYSLTIPGVTASVFYIEDVDIFGNTIEHGPFALGETVGARIAPEPIDWAAIHAEHQAKAQARASADIAKVNEFLASQAMGPSAMVQQTPLQEWPGFVELDPNAVMGSIYLPLLSTPG